MEVTHLLQVWVSALFGLTHWKVQDDITNPLGHLWWTELQFCFVLNQLLQPVNTSGTSGCWQRNPDSQRPSQPVISLTDSLKVLQESWLAQLVLYLRTWIHPCMYVLDFISSLPASEDSVCLVYPECCVNPEKSCDKGPLLLKALTSKIPSIACIPAFTNLFVCIHQLRD